MGKSKRALITSATSSIGEEISKSLRTAGYSITAHYFSIVEHNKFAKKSLTGKLISTSQVADVVMMCINNEGLCGEIIYIDGGESFFAN